MPLEHLGRPAMQARPDDAGAPTVLCVEGDPAQRVFFSEHLGVEGYDVVTVADGAAAEAAISERVPHAVLLDLALPDIDGVVLCRRLATWPGSPIIVVSAERSEQRIIAALDAGASDYVTKPFNVAVLAARLRATLRDRTLSRRVLSDEVLAAGDLVLDVGAHEVRVAGEPVQLHARPFAVLEQLLRHQGAPVPYAVLAGKRRGQPVTRSETQALRIVTSRIRKAIGSGPGRPAIVAEPRVGYRLVVPG